MTSLPALRPAACALHLHRLYKVCLSFPREAIVAASGGVRAAGTDQRRVSLNS